MARTASTVAGVRWSNADRDPGEVLRHELPLGLALGRPAEGVEGRAPEVPRRAKDAEGRAGTADELDLASESEVRQERRLEHVDRTCAGECMREGFSFFVEKVQAGHFVLVLDRRQGIEAAGERFADSARQRSRRRLVLAPPPGAPARGSAPATRLFWKPMSSVTRRRTTWRRPSGQLGSGSRCGGTARRAVDPVDGNGAGPAPGAVAARAAVTASGEATAVRPQATAAKLAGTSTPLSRTASVSSVGTRRAGVRTGRRHRGGPGWRPDDRPSVARRSSGRRRRPCLGLGWPGRCAPAAPLPEG